MSSLYHCSINTIKNGQANTGAYIASPSFPNYQYCWLRDGSFIAHSMDLANEYASAEDFFRWVDRVILRYSHKIVALEKCIRDGLPVGREAILHTRFTLDGFEGTIDDTWGNFQVDGYGTWLWALAYHVRKTGHYGMLDELKESIEMTVRYLELAWQLPNYDCWEEHPEYLHPYSLASLYGGLNAIALLEAEGRLVLPHLEPRKLAAKIKEFVLSYGTTEGRLVKHILPSNGDQPPMPLIESAVDSSLLGMSIPFRLLDPLDPLMVETVKEIDRDLVHEDGGVYRYRADVYYGGGQWILLSAWKAIYNLRLGKRDLAIKMMTWIEDQADAQGNLPEQVSRNLLAPTQYEVWLEKWGPIASPLLWSHAMYLILYHELQESQTT